MGSFGRQEVSGRGEKEEEEEEGEGAKGRRWGREDWRIWKLGVRRGARGEDGKGKERRGYEGRDDVCSVDGWRFGHYEDGFVVVVMTDIHIINR